MIYKKWSNKTELMTGMNVDDTLLLGTEDKANWFVEEIAKKFNITVQKTVKKHLGVNYDWGSDEKGPYADASMKEYEEDIWQSYERIKNKKIKEWETPGYPGTTLVKGNHEVAEDATNYRHIVGKAMFWNQKMGVECNNSTRELSRFMQNPGPEHWKALERYCGYLKGIPFDRLRYRAPEQLRSVTYFDSNFAQNPDDRLSVTGIYETLDDAGVVHTTSQGQRVVSKSSTEAEYMAGSHAADGMVFTTNLINELLGEGTMKKPGLLCGDNQGSLYLMNNMQVGKGQSISTLGLTI